jgi:hypothetical protein
MNLFIPSMFVVLLPVIYQKYDAKLYHIVQLRLATMHPNVKPCFGQFGSGTAHR